MPARTAAMSFALLIGLLTGFLAAGCAPRLPPYTEVEGTVLLDGHPLPHAVVEFVPLLDSFGAGYNSTAATDDEGHYRLVSAFKQTPGALVATHRVLVREEPLPEEYRGRSAENERREKEIRARLTNRPIPPEYGLFAKTPLRVEVVKEKRTYDLNLERAVGQH